MKYSNPNLVAEARVVTRGHALLSAGTVGPVWRVTQGIFKLEQAGPKGQTLIQLAQVGDLIGIETLCAEPYAFTAVALMDAKVSVHAVSHERDREMTLMQGYLQQQRQVCDMHRLRTGQIVQRLAYLLTLLGKQIDGRVLHISRHEMPYLKVMAQVVDSTFETVCRELNTLLPKSKKPPARQATVWAQAESCVLLA